MFDRVFDSLQSLFVQFSVRRLLFWIFLVVVVGTALILYLSTLDPFFYDQMDRRSSLLRQLQVLAQSGVAVDPELGPIYHRLVADLASHDTRGGLFGFSGVPELYEPLIKLISASAVGLFGIVAGLVERARGVSDWKSTAGGGLLFVLIFGPIGLLIPTAYSVWVNALIYVAVQIAVLVWNSRTMPRQQPN